VYKEKIENLKNQRKQVKSEMNEIEEAMLNSETLLNKIDGALELLLTLQSEEKSKKENKDNKK
tara:strand:- start:2732 stop:2920 length:189 start_codon:yes stop_codon:yes gene_type:complete